MKYAKCEFLRVSNKCNPILMHYYIQGQEIKHSTSAQYLGVTIDEHLMWNDHVKTVTSKPNKVKDFLQCSIKHCPTSIKARCYSSMIRPILEYASAIWSPYTQRNIDLVEAVQRRSVRFIFNNYSPYASVTEMLERIDFKTLAERRNESKLIYLYKIVNDLVEINTDDILFSRPSIHNTRGHQLRFLLPPTRINSYHYSFFPSAIQQWNNLPKSVINTSSVEHFKSLLT